MPGPWITAAKVGLPILGSILGGKGGKKQAQQMNQPTYSTSSMSPNSALGGWGSLQGGMDWLNQKWNPSSIPNIGATGSQWNMLGNMAGQSPYEMPDLSSIMGGFNIPEFNPQLMSGFRGGGGWKNFTDSLEDRLGGIQMGGGNWQGMLEHLKGQSAPASEYEQSVLDGDFLDIEKNPYVQKLGRAIRSEMGEDRALALSQMSSPFMADAGSMGMSGANLAARGKVVDDYAENTGQQIAAANYNLYGQERQQQTAVDSILSNRTGQLYSAGAQGYSADQQKAAAAYSTLVNALAGASSNAYGSDNSLAAAIQSAFMGAQASGYGSMLGARASRYGSQAGLTGQYLHASNQNNALNWNRQTDMFNMNNQLTDLDRQNEMWQMQAPMDYNKMLNQIQSMWGVQNTRNQGQQTSPSGGKLQGMLGGALGGAGMFTDLFPK